MDFPGYAVVQEISRSASSLTVRARRGRDRQLVLLKAPAHPGQDGDALEREFELLRDLALPGVCRPIELLRTGGGCLVLEDHGLVSLREARASVVPDPAACIRIARQLCAILGALHERDVIHGGVSPEAVLVSRPAEGTPDVQLLDFSAALRASSETRAPAPLAATPFMSPEQTGRMNRTLDYRTDYYSFGATLYALLTGVPPFRSDDPLELMHAHLARTPASPSTLDGRIPEPLSQVVLRLLAKPAEDRYQSALGIDHDLELCERGLLDRGEIAPFEPGRRDLPERFLVSQKLYGRDRETGLLLNAFERTSEGRTSLLLVSGYAGIGKTALIQELYKPIIRQRGYFVSGKFDQVVRNIPYGALTQAFGGLVRQILTEREERLARWRARLQETLGANVGVLSEVIPEIELILGRQTPPEPLGPTEAQNRFRYVLQSFVGAVAQKDHPLVLFLDDLQWVDAATLDLLHALLTGPGIRHLLLICAYRDNEAGAERLLTWAVDRLGAAGAHVTHLSLQPLAPDDLARLLCDTFRAEPAAVAPLADLVHRKTGGNPFFVIQFLKTLQQDQLIVFDRRQARWTFRIDAIARAATTDNIVDLMTQKIRRLSPRAQHALTLAACIGNQFDWHTFAVATRQDRDEAAAGLSEALQAGLIHMTGGAAAAGPAYAFLHDRVQQAAYAMIPDEQKKPVHLDVGRLLLAQYSGDVPEDRTFEIVNHLNLGGALITDAAERVRVARLNLAAGRKAKTSAAYQAAAGHLEAGIALLGGAHWESDYELMFTLHLEAAECQYLAGAFEHAERYFALLRSRAATRLDLGHVLSLQIVLSENLSRWTDAVSHGREALGLFGITLPAAADETRAALDRERAETERALGERPIASLVDLPVATEPDVAMVMRLLTILWAPAYISGDQLLARLISATMVRLSLAHGNTEDSAYGYVTHAITVGPVRRDYRAAYEWGQLALAVNERFGDTRRRAKIHQQFQAHVSFWRRPFEQCIPHAREARRIGIETGDFTYAGYGAMSEAWPALLVARSLDQFVRDYSPTLALLDRLKMTDFRAAHRIVLNWALALQGRTEGPLSLSDAGFDERAYVVTYGRRDPFFLTFFHVAKLQLAMLLEEHGLALDAARRAREVAVPGTIWPVLIDVWGGLAMAAVQDAAGAAEREDRRRQLAAADASLRDLAGNCPENFRCFWLLLSSAIARMDGNLAEAGRLSEQALEYAQQTGSLANEALAGEMTARTWLARDRPAIAAAFLADARRCYAAWGASVKVAQLDRRYASLLADRDRAAPPTGTRAPAAGAPATLDMATVVKLAHTIAVEMEVGALLQTLMRLALENAGADRGVFLEESNGQLTVAAIAAADAEAAYAAPPAAADQVPDLAHSVIRYVQRTRQDVVLGEPGSDERFAGDAYLATGRAKSVLCVPVGSHERPGGVLYLENSLTRFAFSPARTEMMRVLAAQTAISLENARLYDRMKSEVERRTAAEGALRDALAELQALKERLEAENVYLQEEIRTQHNFNEIVGNSPALLEALRKVERVAPTDSTVLITGETGSGKELFARAVHSRSRRNHRPLVKVNCGAIAPGLVESELFGHVKGAFTGAIERRTGRFEVADGGTIFLDEVGELPLDAQVKLLRVLQEQEFEPVGSSRTVSVNVRVIAATNRNLQDAVAEGAFRADLLYRLNVFPIEVPPLRHRRSDVDLLAGFFLAGLARKLGKPVTGLSVRSMQRIAAYSWPGNVRELQNVVERAAILAQGPVIEVDEMLLGADPGAPRTPPSRSPRETLDEAQRAHIQRVLTMTGGVVDGAKGAAAILGIHANTLRSRMKKLGISAGARKPP